MPTRRDFLRITAIAGAVSVFPLEVGVPRAFGSALVNQVPLPGSTFSKYIDPMPTFAGNRITGTEFVVSVEEFQQHVLPSDFVYPSGFSGTYVWGYRISNGKVTRGPLYPGYTIEARRGRPTTVEYINNLPYHPVLQKYLTVDQTIHWANPLGLMMDDSGRHELYGGPIPIVTHLHGAEVPSEFDGGPDAWYAPVIPDTSRALHGGAYQTLIPTQPNAAVYQYPNSQEATTLWLHDHALGMTRLNVYAGLAAFYLLRDPATLDSGEERPFGLPAGPYEREIVIQDRAFDTNGQLLFPDGRPEGTNGPPPNPEIHPFWNPEFFGDVIVVNGKAWPFFEVEPRRYRLRLLNGSNARFYEIFLQDADGHRPGPAIWVIGNDGGLLDFPVKLKSNNGASAGRLRVASGERYDVIIDFSSFGGRKLVLRNVAPAPFPDGDVPDPETNGQIMQFRVKHERHGLDDSYNPVLGLPLRRPMVRLANAVTGTLANGVVPDVHRQLVLVEVEGTGGPIEVLLNNTEWEGLDEPDRNPIPGSVPDGRGNYLTEVPQVGATEIWEIINLTGDAHPIHLHLVQFQLMNRQVLDADGYFSVYASLFADGQFKPGFGPPMLYTVPNTAGALGGNPDPAPFLEGEPEPPLAEESGWKDTVKMYPGQVTRIVVRFAPQHLAIGQTEAGSNLYPFDPTAGPGYVWHCHILDHEDNEMMRPYNLKH